MTVQLPFLDDEEVKSAPFVAQKEINKDPENQIIIINTEFFPDIKLLDFQMKYRIDGSQHEARQLQALQQGITDTNNFLFNPDNYSKSCDGRSWTCEQVTKGWFNLSEIPAADYGDLNEKEFWYQTAVFAKAKEILVARWPEFFFGKKSRDSKEEPEQQTAELYSDESKHALHKLMCTNQVTIDLI